MLTLSLPEGPLTVLALGAHPNDIEIGCGGTLLALAATQRVTPTHLVLTGTADRQKEARHAAQLFWKGSAVAPALVDHGFADGRLPHVAEKMTRLAASPDRVAHWEARLAAVRALRQDRRS